MSTGFRYYIAEQRISTRLDVVLQVHLAMFKIFLVATSGIDTRYLGRDQGCCFAPNNAQDNPYKKRQSTKNANRLCCG